MVDGNSDLFGEELPDLPEWLDSLIPPPNPNLHVSVADDGERIALTFPDGDVAVVDDLRSVNEVHYETGLDLMIDDAVEERFGDRGLLSYPIEGSSNLGVVLGVTDESRVERLKYSYAQSLSAIASYREDRSFPNAWSMIDKHPAFWTAHDVLGSPFHWSVSGHCSKLRQSLWVEADENGEDSFLIGLETGGTVDKDYPSGEFRYTEHYADWRLEVAAPTFEEAIRLLAERVVLCFNDDGTDRPESEVGLPKPEWILELERRIDEADEEEVENRGNSEADSSPREA